MKSSRSTLILCAFLLSFLLTLPTYVYAHPGRTDSSGGHTNHSTGEYHYHHGYSAHDHYDMDDDGDIDCPYDFVDKTDHHDRSSSSTNSSTNSSDSYTAVVTDPTAANQNAVDWNNLLLNKAPSLLAGVAMFCIMSGWVLCIFSDNIGGFILQIGLFMLPLTAVYMAIIAIALFIIDLLR